MDQRTDSELVIAARLGDKAAFGHLVDRHLPMARRLAMRMIGNQEIAWELAQEAYIQAYLSLDKLREPASFLRWLHGIVRNVCRSHLRSQNLLVGLLHDERSLVAHLLHTVGVTPQQVSQAVERVGRGNVAPTAEPVLAPRTVQVLEHAAEAQAQGGQPLISSEHLLLGLLREGHGMAMTILRDFGVDAQQLKTKLLTAMQTEQ